jgi:hypothetical protein
MTFLPEVLRLRIAACCLFSAVLGVGNLGLAFDGPDPVMNIDSPASDGSAMSGSSYTIAGWAAKASSTVASVQISVDDVFQGYATLGIQRADVYAAHSGYQNAINSGWQFNFDTSNLDPAPAPHTITANVTFQDGLTASLTRSSVVVDPGISVSLNSITGSGPLRIFNIAVTSSLSSQYMQWINGWIAPALGATPGCIFTYWPGANIIYLQDKDANGPFWLPGAVLGSSDPNPTNAQCAINVASSMYNGSTLQLSVTFNPAFQGAQQVWLNAADQWIQTDWTSAGALPLMILTTSLAPGSPGAAYSQALSALGGVPPYTWSLVSGTLPTGITLTNGVLSGAPAASPDTRGSYSLSIQATDGASPPNSAIQSLSLLIADVLPPAVTITWPLPNSLVSGAHYFTGSATDNASPIQNIQISDNNAPMACSYGSGPPCNLPVNGTNNVPFMGWVDTNPDTNPGFPQGHNQVFTVTATDNAPTPLHGSASVTVNVDQPPVVSMSPATGVGGSQQFTFNVTSYAGNRETEWINGWMGPSWTGPDLTIKHVCSFSFWRTGPTTGVIYLLNDDSNAWILPGANIAVGSHDSNPSNGQCTIDVGGSSYNGPDAATASVLTLSLSFNSSFLVPIMSQQPEQIYLETRDTWLASNWHSAGSWTVTAVSITTNSLPNPTQGAFYSQTLSATSTNNVTITWLARYGLPPGLTLSSNGLLSGTLTAQGSYSFTVEADGNGYAQRTFTFTVVGPLTVTPTSISNAEQGVPYPPRQFMATSGTGSYTWSLSSNAPPGVTINAGTGLLTVAPAAGTYSFTVTATDANTNAVGTVTFNNFIVYAPIAIATPTTLPAATIGVAYPSLTFTVSGGAPGITWSPTNSTPVPGMTFSNGVLSGTPSAVGTWTFNLQATDSLNGTTGQVKFTLVVASPPTITMSSPVPSPVIVSNNQNVSFTQAITALNGFTGVVGFSIPPNSLCWGGQASIPAVNLTADSPSQSVTGTIIPLANRTESNVVNQCEIDAVNTQFGSSQKLAFFVPVQVFSGGAFTVTGPISYVTLYINADGTIPATKVNLQINPINGFTGPVNFTAPPGPILVAGSGTVTSSAPITVQVNIQATNSASLSSAPTPLTILANGQPVLTLYTITLSGAPLLTLAPAAPIRTANGAGSASFLIKVTSPPDFTNTVTLSTTGLPSNATFFFSPMTVPGSGTSLLTVRVPSFSSPIKFSATAQSLSPHASGVSRSSTVFAVSPQLTINPYLESTPTPATIIDPWDAISGCSPLFIWDYGVDTTQYQLQIGRTKGGFDISNGQWQTLQYARVNLPVGTPIYARLTSQYEDTATESVDSYYPGGCGLSGPNDVEVIPIVAHPVNAPLATVRNDGSAVQYLYIPDPSTANVQNFGPLFVPCNTYSKNIQAWVSGFDVASNALWVSFRADAYAQMGWPQTVTCTWAGSHENVEVPLDGGISVTDATPVITGVSPDPSTTSFPAGQPIWLTIMGQNFGAQPSIQNAANALAFCTDGQNPCKPNPAITYTIVDWSDAIINVQVQSSLAGPFDVQVRRGISGSGNGFYPQGQTGSWSIARLAVQFQVNVPPVTISRADISSNQIIVVLNGDQGATGNLTVTLAGIPPNNANVTIARMDRATPGSIQLSFPRQSLPAGQYGTLTATWTVNTPPNSATRGVSFNVLGNTRFSTHNVPAESACTGEQSPAFIFDQYGGPPGSACHFLTANLNTTFMSQTALNGTGNSSSFGILKPQATLNYCELPPGGTNGNTFYQVPSVTGVCLTSLAGGVSLATYPSPRPANETWRCSDQVLLVDGQGRADSIKTVQDSCPACAGGSHIDTYSSSPACNVGSLVDYGNFNAIRLR